MDAANPAANRVVRKSGDVQALAVKPDGDRLVVGRNGPNSRIWHLKQSGTFRNAIDLSGAPDGIGSMQISSDSRWLVATSAVPAVRSTKNYKRNGSWSKGEANVWDLFADDPCAKPYASHEGGGVYELSFSADSRKLLVGGDGLARLLELANPNSIVQLPTNGLSVALTPQGRHAIVGDGTKVRLSSTSVEDQLTYARRLSGD